MESKKINGRVRRSGLKLGRILRLEGRQFLTHFNGFLILARHYSRAGSDANYCSERLAE